MARYIFKNGFMRGAAALIAAVLICFCASGVYAVEDAADETEKTAAAVGENKERKKGEKPLLGRGEVGVLVDPMSGRVLFGVDETKRMYPASTTKVMTAMLALEAVERGEISLDEQVTVTSEMLEGLDPDGSNIALKEGEVMSMQNLLYGLMIPSGNDAAAVIAARVGGEISAFVDMMNVRAAELGATETHFANPSGLHDEQHYTTAADMAKIACAAMRMEKFRDIVDIVHIKIPPTNITAEERYYISTNGLLSKMRYLDYYYKGATGIKTGYTSNAGNCLVFSASRDDAELIGVLFGGKDVADSHKDSIEMLDWGFENFSAVAALSEGDMPYEIKVKQGKGTDALTLSVPEAVKVLIPVGAKAEELGFEYDVPAAVYAPVHTGDYVGSVSVVLNGEVVGKGELVANRTIERSAFWPVMAAGEWLWSKLAVRVAVYLILAAAAAAFVLIFILGIYRNIKRAKRRKKREQRRRG